MNELCSLRELGIEFIDGDRGTNYPQSNEFMEDGYCLFLGAHNITDAGFSFEKTQFISEDKDSILRNGKLQRGDIVLMTRGTWGKGGAVGNVALYDESVPYDNIRINSVMLIIRCNKNYSAELLYYLFHSSLIRNQIDKIVTGSVQNQLTAAVVSELKVPRNPNISVQILQAIDKKISINTKQISALESMAKTLYDYWFVQFDFPDANGRPYKTSGGKMVWNEELGRKIPAGWEVSPLSELASYSIERISSSELTCQNYIGMDNMIANRGGVKEANYAPPDGDMVRFEENDILLGNIRPYFKKIWLAGYDGGCNPDVLAIKANEAGMAEFLYATLSQDAFFDYDTAGAKGTKMPRGDKNHIMSYPVPWNMKLAMRFSEQVRSGYRIKNQLTVENNTLTSLRDFLLPILMNGQASI